MPQVYRAFAPPSVGCWAPPFLTKWWDLLDLTKKKILLDLVYMHPGGVRIATDLFFFLKKCNYETPYCVIF